jgi:hypothetical protein
MIWLVTLKGGTVPENSNRAASVIAGVIVGLAVIGVAFIAAFLASLALPVVCG